MDEFEVKCLDCEWEGFATDLISTEDAPNVYDSCPDCGGDNIEDIEEEWED